jgi:hypothetical protein
MKTNDTYTLIEGVFPADEAREILMNMFSTKLQFHALRNLRSIERLGHEDEAAVRRMSELNQSMQDIQATLAQAGSGDRKLIMTSSVQIAFTDIDE